MTETNRLDNGKLDLPAILDLRDDLGPTDGKRPSEIVGAVRRMKTNYVTARSTRDYLYRICTTLYYDSIDAYTKVTGDAQAVVGSVKSDWRHKVHGPFCFENVETVVGYLMDATFPTKDYFTLEPTKREDLFRAKVATALMQKKLTQAQVKSAWEQQLRQACILGWSTLSMQWVRREGVRNFRREDEDIIRLADGSSTKQLVYRPASEKYVEYDNLELICEDPTHIYLDPNASDPNRGNIVRIVPMTLAEILGCMASGEFNNFDTDLMNEAVDDIMQGEMNDPLYMNIQGYGSFNANLIPGEDKPLPVVEFWGDLPVNGRLLCGYHIVCLGQLLLKIEVNNNWAGKPFVTTNYTRVQGRPYGMGLIEPSLCYYLLLDIIQNQRLDVYELAMNGGLFTIKSGSAIGDDDLILHPGKVLEVQDQDDVRLLELPLTAVQVGREEIAAIVEQIKKSSGASDYVSAGPGRSGERVTKEEVSSVRNAGGNRLRLIQTSIESNSFVPFLDKSFKSYTQNIDTKETIRVLGQSSLGRMARQLKLANEDVDMIELGEQDPEPPEYVFIDAGPKEMAGYYEIEARGAEYLINKGEKFSELTQTAALVMANTAMAAHVDAYELLNVLYEHSGTEGYERFVKRNAGVEQMIEMQKMMTQAVQPQAEQGQGGQQGETPAPGGTSTPIAGDQATLQGMAAGGALEPVLQQLSGRTPTNTNAGV